MRLLFGDYEFDTGRRSLVRHGGAVPLSPKAFLFLELLLDRRPEAVSKTELLEHLWPDVFVSDASLHNVVAELRAALRDDARAPRYIRTVHRYGYAFHGQARTAPPPAGEVADEARTGPRLISSQREWFLSRGVNVVGREPGCAVRIDDPGVSRRHARIVIAGLEATIEDLGSKNGTFVDGNQITHVAALDDGAKVRIGCVTITYRALETLPSTRTLRRV